VKTLRLVIAAGFSFAGLGLARVGCWIADIPAATDPTIDALHELREVVLEIPSIHLDGQPHDVALIPRAGVLGAIGQALTEADA
jgi:hypothetical protein